MNERIRQLAKQAEEYADIEYNASDLDWYELKEEKFAELIVRECANLFEIEYGTSEVSGNEVARVLQRHFGVEE